MSETTPPARKRTADYPPILRGLPMIVLGLVVASMAFFRAPWPTDPETYNQSVQHFERLRGETVPLRPGETREDVQDAAWYVRRVMDAVGLLLLLGSYLLSVAAFLFRMRMPLIVLVMISLLGLVYGASGGLLTAGPILTVAGFSLILGGAGLSVLGERSARLGDDSSETTTNWQVTTGTEDDGTYSAA